MSDLTRFVPFAIFVCSASLLVFLVLLGFGLLKNRNPITTRIELACLGFIGTFWISLGAFLASSESQAADVECFASATDQTVISMPGFSTETYHAQYRVLEAFSLFNTILIWGFLLFLLVLALRERSRGEREIWHYPVTTWPWLGPASKASQLPAPVTARSRSRGQSQGEKSSRSQSSRRDGGRDRRDNRFSQWTRQPERAHTGSGRAPQSDKYHRNASPRR